MMDRHTAPAPTWVSRAIGMIPTDILERLAQGLACDIRARHAGLLDRLGPHSEATIFIDPTDLPIGFRLCPAAANIIGVVTRPCWDWQARIAGPLAALLAMVHGESDGDALFFSRTIFIEGDTEAVLALRNALDDAELDFAAEIAGLCGPFKPVVSLGMQIGLPFAERMTGLSLMRRPCP